MNLECCGGAFNDMYLQTGWASTCCPIWYDTYDRTPNYEQTAEQLWMSAVFENMRGHVMNNDYSKCGNCPYTGARTNVDLYGYREGPRRMFVGDSFVCNLKCWSCRDHLISDEPNAEQADKFLRSLLDGYRKSLEVVSFLHTGEVFASKRHVDLMCDWDWDHARLELITNATLVKKHWKRLEPVKGIISRVTFSLDACDEETYKKVRLGGNWKSAVEGVKILSSEVPATDFHYVVSDLNAHTVSEFCHWAQQFHPAFIKLVRMGRTYPRSDWEQHDAWMPDHPKRKLLEEELEKAGQVPNVRMVGF